ncbi:hypothetical protein ABK040_000628 [Willaertia magna]
MSVSNQDVSLNIGVDSIFFSNLLLLGFDPAYYEQRYNMPFHKELFKNSNIRGMEIIMYFLFHKLDSKRAERDFQGTVPVIDKKQRTNFRVVALQWLKELKEKGCLQVLNLQPSLLQSAYGENFYNLLLQLSTYVLRCTFEKEFPDYFNNEIPKALYTNFDNLTQVNEVKAAKNVTILHIRTQTRKLIEKAQSVVEKQEKWKNLANKLTKEFKQIEKQETDILEEEREFKSQINNDVFNQTNSSNRTSQLDNIQKLCKKLDKHFDEHSETRQIIKDTTSGKESKIKLFAEDIIKCNENVNFDKFMTEYPNNKYKLNIPSMIENWTKQLTTLHTLIRHNSLQNETIDESKGQFSILGQKDSNFVGNYVQHESAKQHNYLNSISQFTNEVDQLISEMDSNISNIQQDILGSPNFKSPISRRFAGQRLELTKSTPFSNRVPLIKLTDDNMVDDEMCSQEGENCIAKKLCFDDNADFGDEEEMIREIRFSARNAAKSSSSSKKLIFEDEMKQNTISSNNNGIGQAPSIVKDQKVVDDLLLGEGKTNINKLNGGYNNSAKTKQEGFMPFTTTPISREIVTFSIPDEIESSVRPPSPQDPFSFTQQLSFLVENKDKLLPKALSKLTTDEITIQLEDFEAFSKKL